MVFASGCGLLDRFSLRFLVFHDLPPAEVNSLQSRLELGPGDRLHLTRPSEGTMSRSTVCMGGVRTRRLRPPALRLPRGDGSTGSRPPVTVLPRTSDHASRSSPSCFCRPAEPVAALVISPVCPCS